MTRDNFILKLNEMLNKGFVVNNNLYNDVYKECARLADSGGVDIEEADDNYGVVKAVLKVALENIADGILVSSDFDRAIKNLRNF